MSQRRGGRAPRPLCATAAANAPEPQDQEQEEVEVLEASEVVEDGEPLLDLLELGIPWIPDDVAQAAVAMYQALAGVTLAQGLGMVAAALLAPSALLPSSCTTAATAPLATTLLGCAAVGPFLASALSLHLAGTAMQGELGTWRHQRINGVLGLFSAVSLLSAVWAAPCSTLLLTGLCTLAGAVGAAASVWVACACWPHGPWLQWCLVPEDLKQTLAALSSFLLRDVSTLAGVTCLVLLAVGLYGATGVLLAPASWDLDAVASAALSRLGFHPWWPYATQPATAAALGMLRRAAGAALGLWAVVAHTLLEVAVWSRTHPLMGYLKTHLVRLLELGDAVSELVSPRRQRFAALNLLGLLLAGGVQAAFLARGAVLGLETLNRDAALMGPLHWSCMLTTMYIVVTFATLDWTWAKGVALSAFMMVGGVVERVVHTFMMPSQWLTKQ